MKELRDLFADKEALAEKRKKIKEQALAHRDSAELQKALDDIPEIDAQIRAIDLEIEEIQERDKKREEELKRKMANPVENKFATKEYREAFMNYVQRGVKDDILEFRVDQKTTTTTAATVIPSTVMDMIIKDEKISGNVLPKVRKMNIKGGVKVPTLSVMPEASWIDEDTPSSREKLSTGSVTFSYFGLEVKIAQTLLSEYTSIDAFEAEFVKLAVEAMVNAKEIAIFNGSGTGQPTGILKTSGITEKSIKAAELVKFDKLKAVIHALPAAYRAGAEIYCAQSTWDAIDGMVDSTGQPVARTNYGLDGESMRLFGYNVVIVEEDRIKGLGSATAGTDFIMVIGNMNNYAINSNGDLGVIKYRDEDKNQDVTKALEFCDGKVLQPKAFVRIKLATA